MMNNRLHTARQAHRLTQSQLAKRCGISTTQYRLIESGIIWCPPVLKLSIADELQSDPEELWADSGDNAPAWE